MEKTMFHDEVKVIHEFKILKIFFLFFMFIRLKIAHMPALSWSLYHHQTIPPPTVNPTALLMRVPVLELAYVYPFSANIIGKPYKIHAAAIAQILTPASKARLRTLAVLKPALASEFPVSWNHWNERKPA